MNADGSGRTLVVGNLPGRVDSPSFSLGGQLVMYTHDVAGFEDANGRQLDAHIFLQKPDGTGVIDVSGGGNGSGKPAGTNDVFPRFSPDGSKIIFVNLVNDNLSPLEIWTMDLEGKNRTKLFSNATLPDWK